MIKRIYYALFLVFLTSTFLYSEYIKRGTVESLRDGYFLTVIMTGEPDRDRYNIVADGKIIGTVSSLKSIPDIYGKKRFLCIYNLFDAEHKSVLRPGIDIVIIAGDKEIDKRLQENPYIDTVTYKETIVSLKDNREMVLVPAGKFLFGCSKSSQDEYPEQKVFLDNYYIDKYEVSNRDYRAYADIKGLPYPDYWKGNIDGKDSRYFSSLPVIVTYHEAAAYAKWAGKRLPAETEWEKAARKPLEREAPEGCAKYSWGLNFIDGISNTEELWSSEKTGENLKKTIAEQYNQAVPEKGYIPVDIYEKDSLSYYGAAHLDGNALEWTESWYRAYPGNMKKNKKYGNQYKVVRGGAYFLSKNDIRVTARKIGGIPDLYKDRVAGFRCVKSAAESDKK